MKIKIAHFYLPGTDGRRIQCIVYDTDAQARTNSARERLLADLDRKATLQYNLAVDKSALAYVESGRLGYFGTPDLARHLSEQPFPPDFTKEIDV